MIVKVRMTAFMNGDIREVDIPDDTPPDDILAEVFYWGQNDFQPRGLPSVSVGDVIDYNGLHLVVPVGFKAMTEEEYQAFLALPDRLRRAYEGL